MENHALQSIDSLRQAVGECGYICTEGLASAVFLGCRLKRPVFLEGEAGVGKTEIAKVLAKLLDRKLVRLQCFEGIDINSAAYEWNYAAQMLEIRLAEASGALRAKTSALDVPDSAVQDTAQEPCDTVGQMMKHLYSKRFLMSRPLLEALTSDGKPPVLLVDEIDRADAPFEAFLLEALSDYQITIPELGTLKAAEPPIVFLTSNRTREVHDALKRRCFYHWVGYPTLEQELEILRVQIPQLPEALRGAIARFVQALRNEDLFKKPGVAESLDWARALLALDTISLDPETLSNTLGALLKYQEDLARMQGGDLHRILEKTA